MSYQTGTASNTIDLLQKIGTWLASIGWTIDSSIARGTGWRLHCHKGTLYMNFSAAFNETGPAGGFSTTYGASGRYFIALYAGTGYSGASDWRTQAGRPVGDGTAVTVGAGCPMPSGAIAAYHFFADAAGDNCILVIERTTGLFSHMFWGSSLNKIGTWTGGPYFGASLDTYLLGYVNTDTEAGCLYSTYPPGYCNGASGFQEAFVRADVDAFTGKWVAIGIATQPNYGYTGLNGRSSLSGEGTAIRALDISKVIARGTSNLTAQSLLFPIVFTAERNAGTLFSLLGSIPNVFACNACNKGFAPGGEYLWGGDTYIIFPGSQITILLRNYGFAIKKV